jgi:uncharacterized protein (TIRG00374 family)
VWLAIRLAVSLLLLTLLFWKIDFSRFTQVVRGANLSLFLISLCSYILLFIFLAYRWQILLHVFAINIPVRKLYGMYLIGVFFNNFLPGAIGGDLVRGVDLYRHTKRGKEAVVSLLVERVLGFTSQLVIATVALVINYSSFQGPFLTSLIVGAMAVYFVILLLLLTPTLFVIINRVLQKLHFHQIGPKVLEIPQAISLYKASPSVLIQSVILSLIIQALTIMIYYVMSRALHLTIPLAYLFLFFPIITMISMLPISLGGLGLREGISLYLFQKVGVDFAHAMGLSLAWFFMLVCTSAVGGVIFALRDSHRLPSPTQGNPQTGIRKSKE